MATLDEKTPLVLKSADPERGEARLPENNAPHLSYWQLFKLFVGFGLRAWGGPAAQLSMMKEQLVMEQKWITVEKFNRVMAVYQVLPGPEATEMCCYFGLLSRGWCGGFLGGLGFVLPGLLLCLLCSFLYFRFGLTSPFVLASFKGIQPVVCAMVLRAVHKLGEHAFQDHATGKASPVLFVIGCVSALQSVMQINFFITLAYSGVLAVLADIAFFNQSKRRLFSLTSVYIMAFLGVYILVAYLVGIGGPAVRRGVIKRKDNFGLLLLGLLGGLVTFGGAYTAIPVIEADAVGDGWMTVEQFLDGLAICNILPAPLVIFVAFVGWAANGLPGSLLMTVGMFTPAFSFTIIGHSAFEMVVGNHKISSFLDGVAASVVGLIGVTAFTLTRHSVKDPLGAIVFMITLGILYGMPNKWTSIFLVFFGVVVGQALYSPWF